MKNKLLSIMLKYHLIDHLVGTAVCIIAGCCWLAYIITLANTIGANQ